GAARPQPRELFCVSSEPQKPDPAAEKAKYQPTAREQAALDKFAARKAADPPAPRIKVRNDGKVTDLSPDHPDKPVGQALQMEALGTVSGAFFHGLLSQLAKASLQGGKIDEAGLNFVLSVIKGIKPKDQLEAMLAAQMAAVHMATMTFAQRLNHVE